MDQLLELGLKKGTPFDEVVIELSGEDVALARQNLKMFVDEDVSSTH